jgi:uncharacterized membrane protein
VSDTTGSAPQAPPAFWRSLLVYSGSRIGVFVAILGLLYGVGVRGLIVVFIALVLSGVLSYFLLDRQRTAFATALEARVERRRAAAAARVGREDDIAEAMIARAEAEAASAQGSPSGGHRGP